MAKELPNLHWIEELLPKSIIRKSMFGGFAYYNNELLVLVMFESFGNTTHKKIKHDFELWNGCMFPVEPVQQAAVKNKYEYLINHPILPKWLYLPQDTENFEFYIEEILKQIKKNNPLFGTVPKSKKKKTSKTIKVKPEKIDTRKPQMFSDEPASERIKAAKNLSDLKNIGPVTEKALIAVGIKTVNEFIKLGWKKIMTKLVAKNKKNNHSLFAYAIIGAIKNKAWNGISEEDKASARVFMKSLRNKK